MRKKIKKFINEIKNQQAQALVETALAIPVLLLLFCGCLQLVHIGIAHMVVRDAVFEASRSAVMNNNDLSQGNRIAHDLCSKVSSGATIFEKKAIDKGSNQYSVTHYLKPIFPIISNIEVKHSCPDFLFDTGAQKQ